MSTGDEVVEPVPVDLVDDSGLPPGKPRSIPRRILSGLLTYGVVILAGWYLVTSLQGEDAVPSALALITGAQVAVVCLLGVVNLATNWPPIVVALPGLRVREAAVTNTASAALSNTVPEGGAVATGLNYAMLRSWGFGLGDITSEVIVTGTWSQLTKYVLLALGLLIAVTQGWGPSYTVWVGVVLAVLVAIALVLLAGILRSRSFAARLGAWADRLVAPVLRRFPKVPAPHLVEALPVFRDEVIGLVRTRWGALTATMLVSQLTAAAILGITCRMQGLDQDTISWAVVVVAWGAMTFASLLVPTPGGLGVAEVVLVGVLGYGLPESQQAAVLAAVLLYRIATFLVPIPIGLCTYIYWRNSTAWRRPHDTRGPSSTPAVASA